MKKEEPIEVRFEKAFRQSVGGNIVFPYLAKQEMAKMVDAIARSDKNIAAILRTGQSAPIKGGFIAEEAHTATFNLDAILKESNARAYTDRYEEWNAHEWNGQILGKNDTPDLIISEDGKVVASAQMKYNKTPEDTARQMSQVKDNQVKYKDVDQLIGPEDQINPQHGEVSVGEHAEAAAYGNTARGGDSVQTDAYNQTAEKSTSTLSDGKSSSTPFTKEEADRMGQGDLKKLKKTESQYETRSTLKHMRNSAANAAAMSAVVSGTLNTIRYIQLAREGKITAAEATYQIVVETVCSAVDSSVKASANVGVQSLMVRYGAEKVAIQAFSKQGIKSIMRTNAVTVGVVCSVEAIKDLVQLGMGKISKDEFYERQGKGLLTTSAGVMGGSLGFVGAEAAVSALGIASTPGLAFVGSLSGGLIAGLAMHFAIENHIEKPYQQLLMNTETLRDATAELQRLSNTVFAGQVVFTKMLEHGYKLEYALQNEFKNIDRAGENALDAILKI